MYNKAPTSIILLPLEFLILTSGIRHPSVLMWLLLLSKATAPCMKPILQAKCKGVLPSRSHTSGLALAFSRNWITLC